MERDKLIEILESASESELTLIQNYILDRVLRKIDSIDLEDLIERAIDKKLEERDQKRESEDNLKDYLKSWDQLKNARTSSVNPTWIYTPDSATTAIDRVDGKWTIEFNDTTGTLVTSSSPSDNGIHITNTLRG